MACTPRTNEGSRYLQGTGFVILLGNLIFDWIVYDHVSKIAAMLEHEIHRNGSADIHSLHEVHDIGTDWNAVWIIFLTSSILTSISFALQFFEWLLRLIRDQNESPYQKLLILICLFLNDLSQYIVTIIIMYATDDVYISYFFSTLLGAIGNYIMFIALTDSKAFHFPKLILFHATLTVTYFVVLLVLMTKAHAINPK